MPDLATRREVADYLKLSANTLSQMAYEGRGPRYILVGNRARYAWEDVKTWLESQTVGGPIAA
nr:helix-turn-helix domain-containing protein [Amycolatopsis lexingtonensis]